MKKLILLLTILSTLSVQANEVTVTYTGQEILDNWSVVENEEELYSTLDETCTLSYGQVLLESKKTFPRVIKVELLVSCRYTNVRAGAGEYYYGHYFAEQYGYNERTEKEILMTWTSPETETFNGKVFLDIECIKGKATLKEIKVTYDGEKQPRNMKWASTPATTAYLGETYTLPELNVRSEDVTYSTSKPEVAIISAEGVLTPISEGNCTITARCEESDTYKGEELSFDLTVKFKANTTGTSETIVLTEAGTLKEKVTDLESLKVNELKVVGPVNGADIQYIRTGAGRIANLESLDLSEAILTPDNTAYSTRFKSSEVSLGGTNYYYFISDDNYQEYQDTGFGSGLQTNIKIYVYNNRLDNAFNGMQNLRRIVLPNTIPAVGDYTFYNCDNLESCPLPESVKRIGTYSFYNCKKLYGANITWRVEEIASHAFDYGGLRQADLSGVRKMGEFALMGQYLEGEVNLASLDSIPQSAFYNCRNITGVRFSPNLKYIGYSAFAYTGITSISIPEGCTEIESAAFDDSKIERISLPESIVKMGSGVFSYTPWYRNITDKDYKDGVLYLGKVAMWVHPKSTATSITVAEGTKAIAGTFAGTNLESISLPSSLKGIGNHAFSCSKLSDISLPAQLSYIGSRAFYGCNGLSEVNLSANIQEIEGEAFSNCKGLVRVKYDVPNASGKLIFNACQGLEKIIFGPNVRYIPESFASGCTNLTKIEFEGVSFNQSAKAESKAAAGGQSLTFGIYAFMNCKSLSSVVIPACTDSIGPNAFSGTNLKTVMCYLRQPINIKSTDLNSKGKSTTIYVADDVLELFAAEENWSKCNLMGTNLTGISPTLFDDGMKSLYKAKKYIKNGAIIIRTDSGNKTYNATGLLLK